MQLCEEDLDRIEARLRRALRAEEGPPGLDAAQMAQRVGLDVKTFRNIARARTLRDLSWTDSQGRRWWPEHLVVEWFDYHRSKMPPKEAES